MFWFFFKVKSVKNLPMPFCLNWNVNLKISVLEKPAGVGSPSLKPCPEKGCLAASCFWWSASTLRSLKIWILGKDLFTRCSWVVRDWKEKARCNFKFHKPWYYWFSNFQNQPYDGPRKQINEILQSQSLTTGLYLIHNNRYAPRLLSLFLFINETTSYFFLHRW